MEVPVSWFYSSSWTLQTRLCFDYGLIWFLLVGRWSFSLRLAQVMMWCPSLFQFTSNVRGVQIWESGSLLLSVFLFHSSVEKVAQGWELQARVTNWGALNYSKQLCCKVLKTMGRRTEVRSKNSVSHGGILPWLVLEDLTHTGMKSWERGQRHFTV